MTEPGRKGEAPVGASCFRTPNHGRDAARAGFLDTTLALCLWACGPPLAAASAGVFTYRFFSLFVPMPSCFAALPALRSIGGQQATPSHEPAVEPRSA
jgi:hypothetical protein